MIRVRRLFFRYNADRCARTALGQRTDGAVVVEIPRVFVFEFHFTNVTVVLLKGSQRNHLIRPKGTTIERATNGIIGCTRKFWRAQNIIGGVGVFLGDGTGLIGLIEVDYPVGKIKLCLRSSISQSVTF